MPFGSGLPASGGSPRLVNPTGKRKSRESPRNLKCVVIIPQPLVKGKKFLPYIGKIFFQQPAAGDFTIRTQIFVNLQSL